MGIQVVRVEVDVHEPTALREELSRLGADVRIRLLPIGDFRTGDALVERKTVRDLQAFTQTHRAYRSRRSRE